MAKQTIIKWAIHLAGAVCAAGSITLFLTFCSEVLFRDRGALDESLMTWEDFYGPVITTLLSVGFLLIPLRGFSFRSIRVWLGAISMTSALTAGAYVMVAPVELRGFHSGNFMIAIGILSFVGFLCGFAGLNGTKAPNQGRQATASPSPTT